VHFRYDKALRVTKVVHNSFLEIMNNTQASIRYWKTSTKRQCGSCLVKRRLKPIACSFLS